MRLTSNLSISTLNSLSERALLVSPAGLTTVQLIFLSHSDSSQSSVSRMLSRTGLIMGRRNHLMRNMAWPLLSCSVYQLWQRTSLVVVVLDMAATMA